MRPRLSASRPAGSEEQRLHRGRDEQPPAGPLRAELEALDDVHRDQRDAQPEERPAVEEVVRDRRLVRAGPERRLERHRLGLGALLLQRAQRGVAQGDQRQGPGQGQREGVDEERRPQRPRGQRPAEGRAGDAADQEPGGRRAGGPRALVRGHHAQQQRDARHREHRRSDAARPAQDDQLAVRLGQAGQQRADRDDADPDAEHEALADPVGQPPGAQRGDEAHQGEDGDHRAGGEVADAELLGEQRQRRGHDPEAHRDEEVDPDQDRDLARQVRQRPPRAARSARGAGRGAHGRADPVTPPGGRRARGRAGSRGRRTRRAARPTARRPGRRCGGPPRPRSAAAAARRRA